MEKPKNSYQDTQGITRCSECHEPLYYMEQKYGQKCRAMCKCEQKEFERGQEIAKEADRERQAERLRHESLMAKRYMCVTFKRVRVTDFNKEIVTKAKNFVTNASEMIRKNFGIYLHGGNSTGKTHLMSAMCNELIEEGYSCLFTNLSTLLKYTSLYKNEDNYMRDRVTTCDFLFLDDIGKEFLGRENRAEEAKFSERILFETINARYNAQLPTIFSSNYSIQELADTLKLDTGIIERIEEMSVSVWALNGDDFRKEKVDKKNEAAKKIGV